MGRKTGPGADIQRKRAYFRMIKFGRAPKPEKSPDWLNEETPLEVEKEAKAKDIRRFSSHRNRGNALQPMLSILIQGYCEDCYNFGTLSFTDGQYLCANCSRSSGKRL